MPSPSRPIAALACSLTLAACAWVELEPDADDVRVVAEPDVAGCERLGTARVEVTDRVLAVQRSPSKIEEELDVLARNAAADMGGNRVVAAGPIRDGEREYAVFECR
jgi:hypothetical protein